MGSLTVVFRRTVFELKMCCRYSVYHRLRNKPKHIPTTGANVRSTLGFDKINVFPLQKMLEMSKKYFVPSVKTSELWPLLEKEAISTLEGISTYNFDAFMMIFFRKNGLYEYGQSFLHYLNSARVPNDITLAHFMILAAENGDEQKAFEAYDKINKSLLVVPTIVELVVKGLSQTSRWKECLQLIGQVDVTHIPSMMDLAMAAFKNRDSTTGRQLIQQVVDSGYEPRSPDFNLWMKIIHQLKSSEDAYWLACQLLTCLRKTEHILTLKNASFLRHVLYRRFSLYVSSITMERNGQCPVCGHKLETPKLSPEEHEELKETFKARLHKGSETYEESNPREMKVFLQFLEKSKPYDIVVDGLNVAYAQNERLKLPEQLLAVVTELWEQGSKPLVLGRKHMRFWNKSLMAIVEQNAKCFYADNISADDPLMIYAALYGGPGTLFVTADLLRDHHYLLVDEKKKELFQRWARSSQVYYTENNGKINIQHHEKYGIYTQGDWKDGWHIPYEQYEPYKPHIPFWNQKLHWLCANSKPPIKQH